MRVGVHVKGGDFHLSDATILSSTSRVLTSLLSHSRLEPPVFRDHGRTNPEEWLAAVNGYRAQMGMTDTQILNEIQRFLAGEPACWFQVLRPHIVTWDQFADLFQEVFLPLDNQEQIWRGILDRFQSVNEPLPTFVAHMLCEFRKLRAPPPEAEQIEVICKHARKICCCFIWGQNIYSG